MKHSHYDNEPLNSNQTRKERRKLCGCSYCKPHGGENATRYGKHGKTKPKYKDKRS